MSVPARPLVTVIVPVRNGASTLRGALETVAAQTYDNLDIVLSDNASEDDTPSIMKEFCAARKDATYIRHDRALSALQHFRTMIASARGKYVVLCAADDKRNELFVETLVDTLECTPGAVLAFGRLTVVRDGDHAKERTFPFENIDSPPWQRVLKSARLQCFHFYGVWRTAALQRIEMRDCTYWPDMQVMMAANSIGFFVRNNRAIFYYYEVQKSREERARDQGRAAYEPHFRLHMINTVIKGISAVGGGLPLAGLGGAFLAIRELGVILGETRMRVRQRVGRTR